MQGAAGAGIFELARDGMAVGHDASLSLSYEQLAAAGMQHRGLTERLCRAGQQVDSLADRPYNDELGQAARRE